MSADEFHDADRGLAEDALRELVAEIAADDYRAKIGSPLTNNTAYLKAVALLQTDEKQVAAWAEFYETTPDVIRETCDAVGPNRTAVELKLAAPRA